MKDINSITDPVPAESKKLVDQGVSQRKAINLAGLGKSPGSKGKRG